MRRLIAAAVLAAQPAWAQVPQMPPLTASPAQAEMLCVPRAVLDRMAAYAAGQPWRDVSPIMDALRTVATSPTPCTSHAPPNAQDAR